MPDIVLSTVNAKYIHTAFGLRYLLANLGSLQSRADIEEFELSRRPADIVEALLARNPKIIGLGVYIWNVQVTTEVVGMLKRVRPDITLILGGPEVSYEWETQPIVKTADYVITGEADLKFAEVCRQILNDQPPVERVISASLPDFTQLQLPYQLYDEQDIAHRIIYVEASRGCPFTCEFCLSSLDIPVRQVPLGPLLAELKRLLERGATQFKFVDRTFNLNLNSSRAILEFFLEQHQPGHFLHFEMVPDRLPEPLRELIARFPPGALQLEVGVQTFNPEVGHLIQRRQNYERLEDNFHFLRRHTGAYIHADLIVGLPGEALASFGAGFDRMIALGPQEIQVGLLKRLRGTPIVRHDAEWQMVYNPQPPYEILQNKLIDFVTMQKLRRLARYWDLVGNSGNFLETTPLLWRAAERTPDQSGPSRELVTRSPFAAFMRWSEWLYGKIGRTDGIALVRLMELLFEFLVGELDLSPQEVAPGLSRDYRRGGRRDCLGFLQEFVTGKPLPPSRRSSLPKRQARHFASSPLLGKP